MLSAFKTSKIVTIVSGLLGAILFSFMVYLIVVNKDLLKNEGGNDDADDEQYKNMKANANIDNESDIGVSMVRKALDNRGNLGSVGPDSQKLSTKSLII